MRLKCQLTGIILLCTLSTIAQQPAIVKTPDGAIDKSTSTVTGRVYLGDTRAPAHKATVYLQPVAALIADAPSQQRIGFANGSVTISLQTGFDGSFSFFHVPAGSYFVIAVCLGYVSPYTELSLAEARSPYGAEQPLGPAQVAAKELVLKSIPRIKVQSGLPSSVDITLDRGAAISGTITYDDGSPAAGLVVIALARMFQEGKETWAPFEPLPYSQATLISTDDRGNYRISGLPAQKYIVKVTRDSSPRLMYSSSSGSSSSGSNSNTFELSIYSGGTSRLKDATAFSLQTGEERAGEDLRIPISKLHTITGNVVSAQDGHVINGAQMLLQYADDNSMVGYASSTEEDPGFTLSFIYDGDYILTSPASFDVDYQLLPEQPGTLSPPTYEGHPRHQYGSASKPLHVDCDMDGVVIAVPEATAKEAQNYKDALQQQEQEKQLPSPN